MRFRRHCSPHVSLASCWIPWSKPGKTDAAKCNQLESQGLDSVLIPNAEARAFTRFCMHVDSPLPPAVHENRPCLGYLWLIRLHVSAYRTPACTPECSQIHDDGTIQICHYCTASDADAISTSPDSHKHLQGSGVRQDYLETFWSRHKPLPRNNGNPGLFP